MKLENNVFGGLLLIVIILMVFTAFGVVLEYFNI